MKLPLATAAQSTPFQPLRTAHSASGVVPATIYGTDEKPITSGKAFDVLSGACGTVGAAFVAGRDIYLVAGSYGSTGWHKSSDMYPTSTGYLKVETTKRDGTVCTCHVFDAKSPKECYAASCSCQGKEGYTWQLS